MQQKKRPSVVQTRIIIMVMVIVLWAVVIYVAAWGKNYPKPLGLTLKGGKNRGSSYSGILFLRRKKVSDMKGTSFSHGELAGIMSSPNQPNNFPHHVALLNFIIA